VSYQPAPRREAQLPDTVAEPPADIGMGETGRDLYAATPALARLDPDNDYGWAKYLAALSELLDVIAVMVRDDADGNEGWTALASPSRCPEPFLRVLAQWAGIRRWDALDPPDLRALIGPRAPGLWRGTREAMIAAVRRFYPPGQFDPSWIYFEERADGDPYLLRVFTFDFIDHDAAGVAAALQANKPAGLNLIYEVRHGQTWGMLRDSGLTWGQLEDAYGTWAGVLDGQPTQSTEEEP
jgi:Phage tail protein (Tail_P2_I)